MVSHRAAWLRLLVTALLCVVGVVRPVAQRSDADSAARANGPMHVSASSREGELTALRKRVATEWSGDEASLVEVRLDCPAAPLESIDAGASREARPSSSFAEHPRARGPPIA